MLQVTNAAILLAAPAALALILLAFRRSRQSLPRWRRNASCAVRLVSVLLLTLVMATPVLTRRSEQPFCTIFLADVSESVAPAAWEPALPELRRAWARETEAGNLCALVAFAGRAEILIPPGREPFPENTERIAHRIALLKHAAAAAAESGGADAGKAMNALQEWRDLLDVSSTDLARALAAAHAIYREGASNRIVLVTDGRDTTRPPDAIEIPPGLLAVRLDDRLRRDVAVARLEAPLAVRAGAPFDVRVTLHASQPSEVRLSVTLDGRPVRAVGSERTWSIEKAGRTTVRLTKLQQDRAFASGLHRLEVIAETPGDEESWNNVGAAAITVTGRPRVLLVEGTAAEGAPLAAWLRAQDIDFKRESPEQTAARNGVLEEFVAVVLAGVPRGALPDRLVKSISDYVKDSGGGLWVLGSPELKGEQGYARSGIEELLPVTFTEEEPAAGGPPTPPAPNPPAPVPPKPEPGAPKRVLAPTVAMLFLVDKSGSMAGKNIALVKAACIASARTLTPEDYVGVLAFDVRPHWILRFTEADRQKYIEQLVGRLYADGGTHVYPALLEALAAFRKDPRARTASLKHAILLSDGDTQPADFQTVVEDLAEEGVTVSTVCVSAPRFNPTLMSRIAGWGQGKFRFTDSFSKVPALFVQETKRVLATLPRRKSPRPPAAPPKPPPPAPKPPPEPKKEAPPRPLNVVVRDPHEVLKGIDAARLPPLGAILSAAPRPNADVSVPLATPDGRPVLALWRTGLGKAAVWTSDLGGRWSPEWVRWKDSGKLFAQLLRHVSSAAPDTEFASRVYVKRVNGTAKVRIDPGPSDETLAAMDAESRVPIPLRRRADGGHELSVPLQAGGEMRRLRLQHGDGKSLLVGALQAYDPEFAPPDPEHDLFSGAVTAVDWADLATRLDTARVPGERRVDVAPWLILAVLFLLPLDVALRRFNAG